MLDRADMATPVAPRPGAPGRTPGAGHAGGPGGQGPRAGRAAAAGVLSLVVWAAMTGPQHWADPATWAIGGAAVLAVAGLVWRTPRPAGAGWRLSVWGALRLSVWFAGQALRGAVDVARRAFDPALPVTPGWYHHPLRLPPGAPRLVMANAITMLPGTLTAELHGGAGAGHLVIHLLDTRSDPGPDLAALEVRVRGLFALPAPAGPAPAGAMLPDPAALPPGSGLPVAVTVSATPSRPKDMP